MRPPQRARTSLPRDKPKRASAILASKEAKCHPCSPKQTSGRAFPGASFVHFSVECPFNKFDGINCRPKLDAKLLDRVFHRRRQISPPVNDLTHCCFDGLQHFLYCNVTVGSRHGAVASSSSSAGASRQYLRTKGIEPLSSRTGSSVPSRSCSPRTPRGAWPAASCRHWR